MEISALVGDFPQKLDFANQFKKHGMFVTISPNPSTKHKVSRKSRQCTLRYDQLTQIKQYQYCIRVIERCYLPFLSGDTLLVGTTELNKEKNIHMHLMIYDPKLKASNRSKLSMFQRDIYCCEDTLQNLTKKGLNGQKPVDWMNNIVKFDDTVKTYEELLQYMDKDHAENQFIFENIVLEPPSSLFACEKYLQGISSHTYPVLLNNSTKHECEKIFLNI